MTWDTSIYGDMMIYMYGRYMMIRTLQAVILVVSQVVYTLTSIVVISP